MAVNFICGLKSCTSFLLELTGTLIVLLGAFLAFGPYQDDRTWNLRRDSSNNVEVDVPSQDPTHFRLRQVIPTYIYAKWERNPEAFLRAARPVLFIPGHMAKWTQVINIASYLNHKKKVPIWSLDFHASPAGWHSSVLIQQADFAAAALQRIDQLYKDAGLPATQLTVVGHSMGGIVAMKALRLLAARGGNVQVQSLILICTPVLGHPLLLEPRTSSFLASTRADFWSAATPYTVVIAPGDTDPNVPTEMVSLPANVSGRTFLTAAMHGLHSSFSHVNILFSRPSLHVICNLVSAAVNGNLPNASEALTSPLVALFQRPNDPDISHTSQTLARPSEDAASQDAWRIAGLDGNGNVTFESFVIDSLFDSSAAKAGSIGISWKRFDQGNVHIIPSSSASQVFSLILFEEPRPIVREVEQGTRGEDYDEADTINCTSLASVHIGIFNRSGMAHRKSVEAIPVQYPAKACIFHFVPPDQSSFGVHAAMIQRHHSKKNEKRSRLVGSAQWHADHLVNTREAAFGPKDWLLSLWQPKMVRLPPGHAAVSRIDLPFGGLAPFLPIDVRIARGSSSPWGLGALLLSSDMDGANARIAALRRERQPTWVGWAAETDPATFAPRFTPGQTSRTAKGLDHPLYLIISHPAVELVIHVRANFWAMLIRCFRTYIGYVIAAWFGATLILTYARLSHRSGFACLCMWTVISSVVTVLSADDPQADVANGYSPGPLPLPLLIGLHLSLAGFAAFFQRILKFSSQIMAAALGCCRCNFDMPVALDALLWVIALGVHPAACLLALNTRGALVMGSLQRHKNSAQVADSNGDDSPGSLETKSWLASLVALQLICTLFYTPSAILTGWLLNGQHKEASISRYQDALLEDLKTSRHAFSPFVDSYFLERRTELRHLIELPALGLVLPVISLAVHVSNIKRARLVGNGTGTMQLHQVARLCRGMLLVIALVAVPIVGHRPHRLWYACQPAFAVHAVIPIAAFVKRMQDGGISTKME